MSATVSAVVDDTSTCDSPAVRMIRAARFTADPK